MNDLEKLLTYKREELLNIEVPEEMEDCLRNALNKRKKHIPKSAIAAALIAVLLFAYSFDSLAYYGRKFIGYDNVTYGSLKELNEEGKGQEINKSCVFSNGIEVTLDGIIFDDNELVAFYKIKSTKEKLDPLKYDISMQLYGINLMGYHAKSGQREFRDDYNNICVAWFEAPAFYEKWMKLNISLRIDDTVEERTIKFTLDRNKAMKKTVEKKLDAKVKLGDYEVHFDKLTASSLSTYIKGKVKVSADNAKSALGRNIISEYEQGLQFIDFDIVTDKGEKVNLNNRSTENSGNEITFVKSGDALPKEFNTLEIKNIRFENYKIIDKSFDVSVETKNLKVDDEVIVKEIYYEGDETCIVVSSRDIPIMQVNVGDDTGILNYDQYKNDVENEEPVERTFRLAGKQKEIKLQFKGMVNYIYTDETISIPVD